jgi:hypothetical protein
VRSGARLVMAGPRAAGDDGAGGGAQAGAARP